MEPIPTTSPFESRSRKHRSALTNGNRLFVIEAADGRSAAVRRFRDILDQVLADLGGPDRLSEGQRQLARRAATLSIMAESMESDAICNRPFDCDVYGILTDRMGRCFQRLGLKRVARDVTSLRQYLAAPSAKPSGSGGRD